MADPLAPVLKVVRRMMVRHSARFHNFIRRPCPPRIITNQPTTTKCGSTSLLCLSFYFLSFLLENSEFLRDTLISRQILPRGDLDPLIDLAAINRSGWSLKNGSAPYGEYANFNYRRCPWGGRFIYEKCRACVRDDRYQPLGGFAANGGPRRVLDVTIRRARDWRADDPPTEGFIVLERRDAPPQKFYSPPLGVLARRHLNGRRRGRIYSQGAVARGGGTVFQFRQARMKYYERSFDWK